MNDSAPIPRPAPRSVPLGRLLLAWLLLLGLLPVAFWLLTLRAGWQIFALVVLWLVAAKGSSLLVMPSADRRRLTGLRFLAYLLFAGIQQPRRFLPECVPTRSDIRPTLLGVVANLAAAMLFLYGIPFLLPVQTPLLVRVWSGLIGAAFLTLFVRFDLLVMLFRWLGFGVEKCWHNPVAASSLSDFWGQRWNRIMSGWMSDVLFLPLTRRIGVGASMFVVFLYSGVLHEAFSVIAHAWYGGPTLYFLTQGAGVWLEGQRGFRPVL